MDLDDLNKQMIDWRRDLHAHPEFGTEEKRTSALVAKDCESFPPALRLPSARRTAT